MIVRLATFASTTPDVRAEAIRNLRERFQPALIAQPGFIAGYWAEAEDGRLVSITVWESEAAAEQAGVAANATPLLPGQDPAKIPSPERVDTLRVISSA
jgi:heme-degrading monooxygenase HmoA